MARVKPWESSYTPSYANRTAADVMSNENPFLLFAEGSNPNHPIGKHALLLKCSEWTFADISIELRERIRRFAREHKISILNHGWREEGLVVNFRTLVDAVRFRMLWEDDEDVQCVGIGQCKT